MRSLQSSPWMKRTLLVLYYIEFTAIFVFLLWKCRYGFADMDEAFYLTVPYRFVHGDRMLVNEWHLSQFSFFTMIPEMWLYLQIAKTTEGIVLAFRYIYTVLWSAGALFLYLRARKIQEYGARCASLFMMCYAPFGIMVFSYNSLCILYLVNAAIFLLCAERYKKVQFAVSGIFYAGAVLCCPYLAVIYLVYSILLGAARLRKKKPFIVINQTDAATCWKYFTIGICVLAVIFLTVLFSGASPAKVIESLGYALQDPEHTAFSPVYKTTEYFQRIGRSNAFFYPMLIIVIIMTALSLYKRKVLWFCVVCAAVTLYLRRFLQEYGYLNFLMFPMTFAGIYVMAVTKSPRIRCIGSLWLIPGIIYTYCLNYSSNQFFYAISSASSVSSIASMIMVWQYCDELKECYQAKKKGNLICICGYLAVLVCFVFQMKYEIPIRYQSVYWEPGLMKYEVQMEIDQGPEKGVIATLEKAEKYKEYYTDAMEINHQKVLFLSEQFWMYLINENEMATYSGWQWRVNPEVVARLKKYYSVCPEKKPEIIFLDRERKELLVYFDANEFDITRLKSGNYLIRPRENNL